MNETDPKQLCRICLSDSIHFSNIFVGQSSDENPIYEVINYVYDLDITIDDGLSEYVCRECLRIIKEFETYKRNAHKSKRELLLLREKNNVFVKVEVDDYFDSTDSQVAADGQVYESQMDIHESGIYGNGSLEEGKMKGGINSNDIQVMQKERLGCYDSTGSPELSSRLDDVHCSRINYIEYHESETMNNDQKSNIKQEPEEGVNIMAEFLASSRNRDKLADSGFVYTMDRSKGKKKYWRCENRKICNGRAISFATGSEIEVLITKEHTHAPRYEDISVQRMKTSLKRKAIEQLTAHPVALIHEGLNDLGDFAVAALPKCQSLRRMINRTRESLQPTDPQHIKDLHIIPPFTNTITGQQFLLHDNKGNVMDEEGPSSRVIIFASEENIRYLFSSPTWYTDSTFQVIPTLFYQLFTVHASVANEVLPMVYALMQNKREEGYKYVLQKLKDKAKEMGIPNWDTCPSKVMMDFEKAAINAFGSVFPITEIGLCLFHLGKSLYCKIQEVGLQRQYNEEDSKVRQWLLSFIGLAFVPLEDVVNVFELLLGVLNEEKEDSLLPLEDVADYVDKTYIRGYPVRGGRQPPTYSLEMWNMYHKTRDDIARTNSAVEGWHNKFNKMVNKKKVNIYSLLGEIRKEQHDTEAAILQINSGHKSIKQICSRKTIMRNERIKSIVDQYEEFKESGEILQYLKILGYNLEF